ncbi:MAG: hypothetical protein VB104_12115 [Candidatus Limiplasma sp.]|nr:hypothetical protein [Candidatus Limiplasma sp.]
MNRMPLTALPGQSLFTDAEGRGVLTGAPLGDVRRLCLPPAPGPFGVLRPPLDAAALRLSLELAYMTYTLDLEPWMRAGWRDISIQVDNRLESGVTVGESESATSERIRGLMNGWKVARARMALKAYNPLSQLTAALRQRERSDTIKAVTMLHPAGPGRYMVAIGFMGTGSRFYDWFSNFRFTTEDGFHKGFLQLTETFEQSAGRIRFPDTAAALGRSSLTLADILDEMRTPDSRFTLWMAGHSQGAAVMQVFCHRLLASHGVLPRHIVGYGFASPTTVTAANGRDLAAYPLYHLLNTDDLVPRIGALAHLGLCLEYPADDALRGEAYGWSDTPQEQALRAQAEALFAPIEDTPTMLETLTAFCLTLNAEKTEESFAALMEKRWNVPALHRALDFAGDKLTDSIDRLARYARVAYRAIAGRRMQEDTVAALCDAMRPTIRELPLRQLLGALRDRYHPPHMLCREHLATGAYGYIVLQGSARLVPFVWREQPSGAPRKVCTEECAPVFTPAPGDAATVRQPRCIRPRTPALPSARARGLGRLRTARCAKPGSQRRSVARIAAPPHRRRRLWRFRRPKAR